MEFITANELKTKGISSLEKVFAKEDEVIISVRGKPRYVVMELEQYDRLREADIYMAWKEAREAVVKGDYEVIDSVEDHMKRLENELAEDNV